MVAALIAVALLAPRPDLTVASVAAPKSVASPGLMTAPTSIANEGGRRARRSHARFWLSRDMRRGQDVRLRYIRVPRIAAGAIWHKRAELHVPSGTKPGRYHVIACADSGRVVDERRERNNCRVSPDTVRVVQGTEPQIPPGPR